MTDEGEEPSEARYWAPDDAVRISCGMEIVKHKQDMANKILPGAMVIYLSICRHRDLNLFQKSFSKVAEDPKYVGLVKRSLKK